MIVMITAKTASENAPKRSDVASDLSTTPPCAANSTITVSLETYHKLPARLIGFHHSMRFPDVLEAEHSGWLRLIAACRHLFGDGLKRNVREGKLRRAEHEAAEESQIDAACHLQERVEVGDRCETAQPAGQAGATTPAEHPEGIKDGAVADEVKHRINALCFGDAFREVGSLDLHPLRAEILELFESLSVAGRCDDLCACVYCHIERCHSKG